MERRNAKILFGKNGNGFTSTKITLPVPWIKEMGFSEDDKNAIIEFNEKEIIIKKGEIDMKKELVLNKNLGYFLRILSFSKSYKLEAIKFLNDIDLGVQQVDYQEYSNINEQHIYNISEFIEEAKQDAKITFKDKKGNEYVFIIE